MCIIIRMNHLLIIHSNFLNENGDPGPEYQARIEEGIELYTRWRVDKILFTGWIATKWINKMHSHVGKEWTIKNWFTNGDILFTEEMGSLETVWEVLFARMEHQSDLLWDENIATILSSDYHIPRLSSISNFIFWKRKLWLYFRGIGWFDRSLESERNSLNAFYSTFAWVPIGDIKRIEETLWKNHWLYRNHPSNPHRLSSDSRD